MHTKFATKKIELPSIDTYKQDKKLKKPPQLERCCKQEWKSSNLQDEA